MISNLSSTATEASDRSISKHRARRRRAAGGPLLLALASVLGASAPARDWTAYSNEYRPEDLAGRPNILWICAEDTNAWMGCYGDPTVETPVLDRLAAGGMRFARAYAPSAVCSATRSAVITGMYQTSIGAHEHYSSRSLFRGNPMEVWDPNHLGIRTIPELFRAAGYYTFNEGKDDYNFVYDPALLYDRRTGHEQMDFKGAADGTEWSGRRPGQPFFGQIQLIGGKFRNPERVTDRAAVAVPPYYPDHPAFREGIAHHYDTIRELDRAVGQILDALRRDGLLESTVVVFFSDHGSDLPRHKQFLYEGGIRVPLILAGPGVPAGVVSDRLVSLLDLGATSLALAGLPVPRGRHGQDLLAEDYRRDYVVAARDRCDFTIDRIRSVTTARYKYIRNFFPERPWMQPNYRSGWPTFRALEELRDAGTLDEVQARFAAPERPAEEFYDLVEDPHETRNLVASARRDHAVALAEHRDILYRWILETDDRGRFPESPEALRAVVDRWGDAAVNPEYDEVR